MARRPTTDQLDLFAHPHVAKAAGMPPWQALPAEARLALTRLMATPWGVPAEAVRTKKKGRRP